MPHIYISSLKTHRGPPHLTPFLHLNKLLIKLLISFSVIRATFGGFNKKKKNGPWIGGFVDDQRLKFYWMDFTASKLLVEGSWLWGCVKPNGSPDRGLIMEALGDGERPVPWHTPAPLPSLRREMEAEQSDPNSWSTAILLGRGAKWRINEFGKWPSQYSRWRLSHFWLEYVRQEMESTTETGWNDPKNNEKCLSSLILLVKYIH